MTTQLLREIGLNEMAPIEKRREVIRERFPKLASITYDEIKQYLTDYLEETGMSWKGAAVVSSKIVSGMAKNKLTLFDVAASFDKELATRFKSIIPNWNPQTVETMTAFLAKNIERLGK